MAIGGGTAGDLVGRRGGVWAVPVGRNAAVPAWQNYLKNLIFNFSGVFLTQKTHF